MKKGLLLTIAFISVCVVLYFLLHDRKLEKPEADKIADSIEFNPAFLKPYHGKVHVNYKARSICGNDPTEYYWSDAWTSVLKNKLQTAELTTIVFNNDSIASADSIPTIKIVCYLLDNDVFDTEVKIEIYYNYGVLATTEAVNQNFILYLKENIWKKRIYLQ